MIPQAVTVLGSEMHLLESRHTSRTYRITVSLPLGYFAAPGEGWPFHNIPAKWRTVYVLDGNWYADMVTGMIRPMSLCGSTTDAIVVGIGYPEDADPREAFRTSFTRRDHDLTPVWDEATEASMTATHKRPVPNGDGGNFHKFIRDELIPFVEQTYNADPSARILVGHSYGGLFGLFGMFVTPQLFQTLIIGSPTLSYSNHFTFQQEATFASASKRLPVKMYLFAGEREESLDDRTLTDTLRLAATLESREYEAFSLSKHVFADQNHCEVAAAGFQWGLKHALKK
jgi:predicted alpha/beta superfamily hydrolase